MLPGNKKKAKSNKDKANFLLKPVFKNTAKGGKNRQVSTKSRRS